MTDKEREELAKRWTAICEKYSEQPHRGCQQSYNVWMQGYECTGQSCPDTYMGTFTADTFKNACMRAMRANGYSEEDIEEYYNASNNSFWGCSFFEGSKPTSYEELEYEIQELKKEVNKLREKLCMTDMRCGDER